MAGLIEMATEIGQALGRTDEYKALKRAIDAADEERDLVEMRNDVQKLEGEIESILRTGKRPDEELMEKYEKAASELQAHPAYQKVVAAQANFDKIINKVNQSIAKGIQEGGDSRIIVPS